MPRYRTTLRKSIGSEEERARNREERARKIQQLTRYESMYQKHLLEVKQRHPHVSAVQLKAYIQKEIPRRTRYFHFRYHKMMAEL
jgi:hypothetical protein